MARKKETDQERIVRRHREVTDEMAALDRDWSRRRGEYAKAMVDVEARFKERSLRLNEQIERAKAPHVKRWRDVGLLRENLRKELDELREEAIELMFLEQVLWFTGCDTDEKA